MGYEVKIFVVRSNLTHKGHNETADHAYAGIIGMVDVCKPGYDSEIYKLCSSKETDNPLVYLYDLNGNEQHWEDRYGKKLRMWPMSAATAAVEDDANSYGYERFKYALALLHSVNLYSTPDDSRRIGVVFFGY